MIYEEIIKNIKANSTLNLDSITSKYFCTQDICTAIIHHKSKMDTKEIEFFSTNNLIDNEGFTQSCYTLTQLDKIKSNTPNAIKRVTALWHKKEAQNLCYQPKYPKDKWKKLQDTIEIIATTQYTNLSNCPPKDAETAIRDTIRSIKEIPSLKPHPFSWIANGNAEILESLGKHYFEDFEVINLNKTYIVAYHPNLGKLDMRNFIYPPN